MNPAADKKAAPVESHPSTALLYCALMALQKLPLVFMHLLIFVLLN
jgi:hypothetical protein